MESYNNFNQFNYNLSPMNQRNMNLGNLQDDDMNMRPFNPQDFESNNEFNPEDFADFEDSPQKNFADEVIQEEMVNEIGQNLKFLENGELKYCWDEYAERDVKFTDIGLNIAEDQLKGFGKYDNVEGKKGEEKMQIDFDNYAVHEYDMNEQTEIFNRVNKAMKEPKSPNETNANPMNPGSKSNQPMANINVFNQENSGNNNYI